MKHLHKMRYPATVWLALVLATCMVFAAAPAEAPMAEQASNEPAPPPVEVLFWSHRYTGQVAGKAVEVRLERVGAMVKGSYCYRPCRQATRDRLQLKGVVQADATLALAGQEVGDANRAGNW